MTRRAVTALLVTLTLGLAACGSDDDNGPRPTPTATANPTATVPPATATSVATATAVGATATVPPATAVPTATATVPPTATATEAGTATPTEGVPVAAYPAQQCASAKQLAAASYCQATLDAWAQWDRDGDASARDAALAAARTALGSGWTAAEGDASGLGVECADAAFTSTTAADAIDTEIGSIVTIANSGLDLEVEGECGAARLSAAGSRCQAILASESRYLRNLAGDPEEATLNAEKAAAAEQFLTAWDATTSGDCPPNEDASFVAEHVDFAAARVVRDTTVSPSVAAGTYTTISPTGSTEYLGKTLTPICMDGSPYHFFVRRGTVNKLVMYYQGGGACWDSLTCSVPTCDPNVAPTGDDNPNAFSSGFADFDNPDNPFRDWHSVIVSYCSCDVHYGDAAQDYAASSASVHVEHRGFHNAQIAEKWAREHFVNPDEVFVTGSSAGAYGAFFNAPALHLAYPASRFNVLGDAGNGVITPAFLAGPFANWNFTANLPDTIPGVIEAIEEGTGIPAYTEAVAAFFPTTNWAHYTTAFDGGSGGQTGFYNIMLNDNFPLAALRWWEASCAFTSVMRSQALDTAARVPDNYRYYIGTGSRHTMWGANKVYDDTTGGVPTVVSWIDAMLDSRPGAPDLGWTNVECENCGLLLQGDPQPTPLEPPFQQIGEDIVIVCE